MVASSNLPASRERANGIRSCNRLPELLVASRTRLEFPDVYTDIPREMLPQGNNEMLYEPQIELLR